MRLIGISERSLEAMCKRYTIYIYLYLSRYLYLLSISIISFYISITVVLMYWYISTIEYKKELHLENLSHLTEPYSKILLIQECKLNRWFFSYCFPFIYDIRLFTYNFFIYNHHLVFWLGKTTHVENGVYDGYCRNSEGPQRNSND